jgi:hypothetical protein
MGRPCRCCKKEFPFIIIIFIDESTPYSFSSDGRSIYEQDLLELRDLQLQIGKVSIILVQPSYTESPADALLPDGFVFPEEVVQVYDNYTRNGPGSDRNNQEIFKSITENHIRDNFSCIGVAVDNSGSTRISEIRPGLDCWYFNISDGKGGKLCDFYINEPLPDCENGELNLSLANGCVEEVIFGTEQWLREAADVMRILNAKGCSNKKNEDES